GQITEGSFMEFLHSHTNVVAQPGFDDRRYYGINPYALGFAMMKDIERICVSPHAEDRQWFPDIAGNNDPVNTLKDIWANYRDESFVSQFLSPHIIRKLGLFLVVDDHREKELAVDAIHNERGYTKVRRALARHYDVSRHDPDIQIVDVDLEGDRRLELRHQIVDGVTLDEDDAERVLQHLANLWGYEVYLIETNSEGEAGTKHHAEPVHPFM
ncbi:MAG: SpoVR family protein, partial [Rhodomicrobium sp.]